jgi:hypothetical protein
VCIRCVIYPNSDNKMRPIAGRGARILRDECL